MATKKQEKTTPKSVSDRNTKAEILEAYNELKKEKSTLQSQVNQLRSQGSPKMIEETVVQPVIVTPASNTSNTSKKSKMQGTIDNLMLLQLGFGSAVSELSEQLTAEATKLAELQQRFETEREQLETLHRLATVEDDTLETLVQQYEQSSKQFEAELTERRETLDQQVQEQNKTWQKEQEEHQRQVKERNEDLKKSRLRDQESYQYNLNLQRSLDHETYEQNKQTLYKQLDEFQQNQEKQWTEREKAIAEREKRYGEVKAKVEEFPHKLEDSVKKGKELGRNIGNYQAKIKADLFAKEVEGQKQFYELRIKSLMETIQNQESRIQSLSKQLDSALKQVQDLAVKAIEGASNVNSFQAVKEIALEQAKNPNKGK